MLCMKPSNIIHAAECEESTFQVTNVDDIMELFNSSAVMFDHKAHENADRLLLLLVVVLNDASEIVKVNMGPL